MIKKIKKIKNIPSVLRCVDCPKWYRRSGSIQGICLKQHKKITMYNDKCMVQQPPVCEV